MKRLSVTLAAIFAAFVSFAQVDPNAPLQRDPNLLYGKLDNGMTYYIMHNELPAQRAEYYLLTDVGAIQETPAQDGLAHFLEHMALNGTKNFPGKGIINYMQSIGASFGANINASTGVEQTMYMFNNIPTTREGIIDSCILAVHDYSGFVTNDPEEIEKERGVIVEEWRTRRTSDWRMHEQSLKYLYKGSKYESCTIIGTKENLETFPAEELQKFYKTWYRPDLQAIVVIGDVDPQAVLAKIQTTFADIPARENPEPKGVYKTPDNEEPIVGIITDPEAQTTRVVGYVKSEPLPKPYMSFGVGYMMDLIKDVINAMFNERLTDIAHQPNAPFLYGAAQWSRINNFMEGFNMAAVTKDGEALEGFKAVVTEVEKAQRYGFTQAEFDRVKTNMIANAEKATSNASSRKNPELVYGVMTDFYMGYPMMAPSYAEDQLKGYLSMIPLDQINQIVASTDYTKNFVIIYSAPEREGLTHPSEQQFKDVIAQVKNSEIKANEAEEDLGELLDASKLKGSKTRKEAGGIYGSTTWVLRNGIRVTIRPSQYKKEEIRLNLSIPGGESAIADENIPSLDENVFSLYCQLCGVSQFPATKLTKMLTGKIVSEYPYISDYFHGVMGSCAPKDFETLMQLVYLQIVDPRFVEEEFAPGMAQLNAIVPNIEKQPNFAFYREYNNVVYGNSPRKELISTDKLSRISFASLEKSYRKLFSNMAGAEVVITGNIDPTIAKPLAEKYIGSLPCLKTANKWIDRKDDIVPGKIDKSFTFPMTTPKSTCAMVVSGDMEGNFRNRVIMNLFSECLDILYTDTIREEEGGTYGVSASGSVSSIPTGRAQLEISFDTDPDRADKLFGLVESGLQQMAVQGPTAEQLSKVKENALKKIPENRIVNGYWESCILAKYRHGNDLDTGKEALIESITAEDISKFATSLLSQGNVIKLVMNPEK